MFQFFLILGIVGIIISGDFMGVWTDGQQQRANFHSETRELSNFRTKINLYSGLAGVISLGIAGIIYLI